MEKKKNEYIVRLFVKDNCTGHVHEVGSNPHDSLIILEESLHYYNLQCGCGTYGGAFSFCDKNGNTDFNTEERDSFYPFMYKKISS